MKISLASGPPWPPAAKEKGTPYSRAMLVIQCHSDSLCLAMRSGSPLPNGTSS